MTSMSATDMLPAGANSLHDTAGSSGASAARSTPFPVSGPAYLQTGRFHGSARAFFGLLLRGSILLMLTLGIYRFWLATDVRRFLWGHTEVSGERFEYTGTPSELLIGFLMAVALVMPINGVLFLGTLAPAILPFSSIVGFVLLFLLGRFAIFRARRYRLTRTVYRGIRLYQTGSAWGFALRSTLWWTLTFFTAGLAYPWQTASLERYKMRHTHFGDLDGRFVGSGTRLFFRGMGLWLVVIGPTLAGIVTAIASLNWPALGAALTSEGGNTWSQIEAGNPAFGASLALAAFGLGWGVLAAAVLYPAFRAMVLRWWVSGLRLGPVTASSRLRTPQVYGVYFRFLGYALLFALGASVAGGAGAALISALPGSASGSSGAEIAAVVVGVAAYVAIALGYSAIFQSTVMLPLWRLSFETADFSGTEALARVSARGGPASAFGEGLADALDVGGL